MKQAAAALSRLDLEGLRYALEVIAGVRTRDKINESPMAGCFLSIIQASIMEEMARRKGVPSPVGGVWDD